jgi:class 3 adenylate cyclase/AAA+ ATPase superfamily predicted ATPase
MEKRNPYTDRKGIRDINRFYGRKQEVSRIYSRIGAPNPQSVSVVGDRRIGKSSLLNFIYHEENRKKYLDNPESYTFVLMDLQEEQRDTISAFIESLLGLTSERVGQNIAFKGRTKEVPPSPLLPSPRRRGAGGEVSLRGRGDYDSLKRLAMELRRKKRKLIILFDEFELITQNEAFDSTFYAFFRGLASNYDIAYVTSSVRDLQELCSVKEIANSPFFNIFSKVHLGPFREAEAIELIEKPSSVAGCHLSKYTDAILSMSGMIPFFIQMACSAFFEYIQAEGGVKSEGDIRKIEELFFDEAEPHFRYIWDEFDDDAKDICKAILSGEEIDEDKKNVVIDLIGRGYVIQKDDEYKLFSSAFANRIVTGYAKKQQSKPVVESGQRICEAIVVMDVCKHSSIIGRIGEQGWVAIASVLDSIVKEVATHHRCQHLVSRGDGYLATFPTLQDAMSATFSILSKMKDYNEGVEERRKIFLRFSVNYGETIVGPSGERLGERVNETFRLDALRESDMPESEKGVQEFPQREYILATERVYNELSSSKEVDFKLLGIVELRGLPGLHRIYEVRQQRLTHSK